MANGTCLTTNECEFDDDGFVTKGVCSDETEELLTLREECAFVYLQQKEFILQTILRSLLINMCRIEVVITLIQNTSPDQRASSETISERLLPLEAVTEFADATLVTDLNLGNTYLNLL